MNNISSHIPNIMQSCLLIFLMLNISISFTAFASLQSISYLVWGVCCLGFAIMTFLFLRNPIISYFDAAVISYFILLLTFTILNGTDIKYAIYKSIEVFILMMVINYKHNLMLAVKTCALTLSLCVYLNLAIMLIFPDWMFAAKDVFDSYLLGGNYNQIGCRLICAIVLNILCMKAGKIWKFNAVLSIVISIATLALVGSMTSLSCIILFTLFCIIPTFQLQKLALISFFLFFVLFQTIVVFSGEGLHNNPYAVFLIEDVLNKDMTFTHRTSMWDAAAKLFANSPIIGYGYVNSDWYISKMSSFAIGPHNFIYSVLINGGIILLFNLIIICTLAVQKILKSYDKTANILLMGITTLFFMMTMEVYPYIFLFLLLYLAYNYQTFKEQIENGKQ